MISTTRSLSNLPVDNRLQFQALLPLRVMCSRAKIILLSAGFAFLLTTANLGISAAEGGRSDKTYLADGWAIQSSAKIQAPAEEISSPAFKPVNWYKATVPSTVVGNLIDDMVYPDPFFGMNLRSIPGMEYPIGTNFSNRPMPGNSPFKVSWWYRNEFRLTSERAEQVWINFDGINYRANIWLNGKLIADTNRVVGAYRTYTFNVTSIIRTREANVLAVEVFPPDVNSLAITWVDWNPMPPDKNMGLWRDVYVTATGPVALRYPQVLTKVDLPSLDKAHLIVSAELENAGDQPLKATLKGEIEEIRVEQTVELAAHERRRVEFTPDQFAQLNLSQPRLWWPVHVGPQNLYELNLELSVDGKTSAQDLIRFGIREASSELNDKGYRVFKINGRPILVRGGGWATDMFLRPSAEREIAEMRYVKDMNLNAIRFEGKTERGRFLEMCDREGIMVIAGWCCCDYWERWREWKDNDYDVATDSLRDQIRRIRNHPCIITYWYGSDGPPNARAERNYLAVLKELNWPNSAQASATAKKPAVGEATGIRMTGPYDYVPPVYWYVDKEAGGAYCFNTETSPGPAVPPIESLRRMLPPERLWPINEFWSYHAGGGPFRSLGIFTEALNKRFGEAKDVEDYAKKAQVMAYDGERAMFESYGRNKYDSTGVIQWMLNNAWPSTIWHLYDYYLRPGGGYFGTKKACEPLHIQYTYDNRSVDVVNSFPRDFRGLIASAEILNLDMTPKFSRQEQVDVGPDGRQRVFLLPEPSGLTSTYFVKLTLADASGRPVSSNFYWLSLKPDTLGKPNEGSSWYYRPTEQFADFTALNNLPPVDLSISARSERNDKQQTTRVTVENPGRSLAFFVHLKVNEGGGEEILPVLWEDNYFSLLPGEKREVSARYAAEQLHGANAVVELQGWNVRTKTVAGN
jgi:exo-1,4-beta-D-glucosaminidase